LGVPLLKLCPTAPPSIQDGCCFLRYDYLPLKKYFKFAFVVYFFKEKFEDTEGVIGSRKSKNRQDKKKNKQ
jgi:hypothetical protein